MDAGPGAVLSPQTEVMIDGLPRGQVVGQHPPRTAAAQHVEDGVQDLPVGMDRLPAPWRLTFGKVRFDLLPFGIG